MKWNLYVYWIYIMLTRCAQSRTRCELGHINDFDSKLLIGLPVYASPHNGERSSENVFEKEGESKFGLNFNWKLIVSKWGRIKFYFSSEKPKYSYIANS